MEEEIKPDIREISFGSLLFRHIDRILSLSSKDFAKDEDKLFTFDWSVKLLRSSMPDDILDDKFKEAEAEALKGTKAAKTYKERFAAAQTRYGICINHLASKGYLYRKFADGEYDA